MFWCSMAPLFQMRQTEVSFLAVIFVGRWQSFSLEHNNVFVSLLQTVQGNDANLEEWAC